MAALVLVAAVFPVAVAVVVLFHPVSFLALVHLLLPSGSAAPPARHLIHREAMVQIPLLGILVVPLLMVVAVVVQQPAVG